MSRANASFSLPPGDRDEPQPSLLPDEAAEPAAAGRDAPAIATETIARIGLSLDEAQLALADLRAAQRRDDFPGTQAAAWRLSEALMIDLRSLSQRLRRELATARPARTRQPEEAA